MATGNKQIELARRYVCETGVSLFLTGKAGTGKTTFLRELTATCPKRNVVVAPTGVAAVNAGGMTIHSFFQLPPDPYLPDVPELMTEYHTPAAQKPPARNKLNIIRTLELLIIDEISMVRADLLDAIDWRLRRLRRSNLPFGGVQLLMIGDVHQLPPVVTDRERPYMERVYASPFFFSSKALQRLGYVTIELSHVYRQSDADFVELLNKVRNNSLDAATLSALNARVGEPPKDAITLTTHNRQADAINSRHLEALTGEERMMEAVVTGEYPESAYPAECNLKLKVGERVMFLKNDSGPDHAYYNGKLGTVLGFDEEDGDLRVEVEDDEGERLYVGREQWENMHYTMNPDDGQIKQEVAGSFVQYPLRPAWAVTIHKAQGLTFDHVCIDAADAFAFGQVYVALSRCRTLQGLTLRTPLGMGVAFGNSDVEHFVAEQPTMSQIEQAFDAHAQQYYYQQLTQLFSAATLRTDVEKLQAAYAKLRAVYPTSAASMDELLQKAEALAGVGEKFASQLLRLPREQHAGRVSSAATYYSAQLEEMSTRLKELPEVDIDNKETRKQVQESTAAVVERVGLMLACMEAVKEGGFDVPRIQQAKAKYIGMKNEPEPRKRRGGSERGRKRSAAAAETENERAVTALTAWRKQKAAELDVPAYFVMHQKTLMAIATAMPLTLDELASVAGMGKVKMRLYGEEIIGLTNEAKFDS